MPALIAAVSSDALYVLLPQVTVPEDRARGTVAAKLAAMEANRTKVRRTAMIAWTCGGGCEVQARNSDLTKDVPVSSPFILHTREKYKARWLPGARRAFREMTGSPYGREEFHHMCGLAVYLVAPGEVKDGVRGMIRKVANTFFEKEL